MRGNIDIAQRLGFLDKDPDLFIDLAEIQDLPPEKVLLLCTGTQAEPRSVLYKMSLHTHPEVKLHPGDTVVMYPGEDLREGVRVQ
jgi:ribonuclease J